MEHGFGTEHLQPAFSFPDTIVRSWRSRAEGLEEGFLLETWVLGLILFFFSSLFVPQLWTKCNRMSPRAPLLNVPGGLDNIDNKCRWQGLAMEAELLDRLALDFPLMMFPGCAQSTHLRILACTPVIGRSSESDGWQGCLRCSCRCCHDAGC